MVYSEQVHKPDLIEEALTKLVDLVRAGISHGHFEAKIAVRDTSGGRTEIIITAGKQYRFLLPK